MTEPYAVAGDVYDHPAHRGRGGLDLVHRLGGWLYRVAVEGILGLHRRGERFALDPRIPSSWPTFQLEWRFGSTPYTIVVDNPDRRCSGVGHAEHDGRPVNPAAIPLVDDGRPHRVRVVLGAGERLEVAAGPAGIAS